MRTLIFIFLITSSMTMIAQRGFVIDHRHTEISKIPDKYITEAKKNIQGDIYACCYGRQKNAGGFYWEYKKV